MGFGLGRKCVVMGIYTHVNWLDGIGIMWDAYISLNRAFCGLVISLEKGFHLDIRLSSHE